MRAMNAGFDQPFHQSLESDIKPGSMYEQLTASDLASYEMDFAQPLVPASAAQSPASNNMTSSHATLSPTPSRLAGEPAFCSGRHCCQWTVGGFICNNHYASAADLDHHVATDHAGRLPNREPSGDYHCYWAGCSKTESFGNKPKLTRHIHSHTGHKPHPCPFPGCGKGFVTKEQLKNHETTHTKSKEHICPECGKGFAVKTALTSHMNVHRGAKPYICDECGKGFADSSNLSKHKAIHKRASMKRHRHHLHRASISTTASSSSSTILATPFAGMSPSVHGFQTPLRSIEAFADNGSCIRPCYDNRCQDQFRVPCRSESPCKSLPCHNDTCDATFDACDVPCELSSCAPCELPDCHSCDLAHCSLPDCIEDCFDPFCTEPFDSLCAASDDQSCQPFWNRGMAHSSAHLSGGELQGAASALELVDADEEGFRQLRNFIAEDFHHVMSTPHVP